MEQPPRYRVDTRRVAGETIDGETIVIDFSSGTYHSLAGAGSQIWALATAGWTVPEISAELVRRHDGDAGGIDAAVRDLVDRLVAADLLDPADPAAPVEPQPAAAVPVNGAREPFVAPVFQSYSDMEYLLLLDPIHDAEAAGWPEERSGPDLGIR